MDERGRAEPQQPNEPRNIKADFAFDNGTAPPICRHSDKSSEQYGSTTAHGSTLDCD